MKNYKIQFVLFVICSLISITTYGNHTPKSLLEIENYLEQQSKSVTAHDIATYFKPQKQEQLQAPNALTATTFGTAAKYGNEASDNGGFAVAALDATHFVVAFSEGATSYAIIGEISSTSITYGTKNAFSAKLSRFISIAALSTTHFVVAYQNDPNNANGNGTAIVGEVSGTTITSFGSESIFNAAPGSYFTYNSIAVLDATHFVVAYKKGTSSSAAVIGEVSGTTITSFGTENVFNSAETTYISTAVLDATHFVIAFVDGGNGNHGTAIVGEVSGTTITSYGSKNVFNAAGSFYLSVAVLDATHFVVAYQDAGNSSHGAVIVGEVSGTTISTYGSEAVFNAGTTYLTRRNITALSSSKVVIVFDDAGDSDKGKAIVGGISGTSISFSSSGEEEFVGNSWFNNVVALSSTHYVVAYEDKTNSNHGYARVGDASAVPLPVELTYFKGENIDNQNHLTWQTASEQNNEGFEIEKSFDGKSWEMIDFVQGNGFTSEVSDYEFVDNLDLGGFENLRGLSLYYRLKQVDFDGNFEYSNIIQLETDNSQLATVHIFPNPTTDFINIEIEAPTTIQIFNNNGQLMVEKSISNTAQINISDLPAGAYYLKTNNRTNQSFIKQ